MLTKERKKQLDTDLWIIAGVSLGALILFTCLIMISLCKNPVF